MKIYVASSWRNTHQPAVVERLRAEGHDVYDFRTAAAFSWAVIAQNWRDWTVKEWLAALLHPASIAGFDSDMGGVEWCDACVMVQPCGQSAGMEAGYVAGSGRLLIVFAPEIREAELMVKMAALITDDLDEVVVRLSQAVGGMTLR